MMRLLWINALRMTSCINDLYNTFQFSLILVLFPRVHQSEPMHRGGHVNISWLEHLQCFWLLPPLHVLSFSFWLSGIILVTGRSSETWVKELCVRPEAVPLLSPFSASPWKSQFSLTLTHTQPGGDAGKWWGAEGSLVRGMMVHWWTQALQPVLSLYESKPC